VELQIQSLGYTVSVSHYITSVIGQLMNELNVEKRGHGLIGSTVQYWNLPEGMEENYKKPHLCEHSQS
jgi:hypothetical protein